MPRRIHKRSGLKPTLRSMMTVISMPNLLTGTCTVSASGSGQVHATRIRSSVFVSPSTIALCAHAPYRCDAPICLPHPSLHSRLLSSSHYDLLRCFNLSYDTGPGTGIAPMRALLQEIRFRLDRDSARNEENIANRSLYFGCQNSKEDFIYR